MKIEFQKDYDMVMPPLECLMIMEKTMFISSVISQLNALDARERLQVIDEANKIKLKDFDDEED